MVGLKCSKKCRILDNPNLFYNRGQCYFKIGKYNKSLNDFQEVLKFNNKDFESYYHLGKCYFKIGKFKKSIKILTKSIHLNQYFHK